MRKRLSPFVFQRRMIRRFACLFAFLLSEMVIVVPPAFSGEIPGEESRRVLVLYNSLAPETPSPDNTRTHKRLEMVFNHLGFFLDYADVNEPLPDSRPYRAVVVWLDSYRMREPERLVPWMLETLEAGGRIVMPNGFDEPETLDGEAMDQGLMTRFWQRFGLEPQRDLFSVQGPLERQVLKPELFAFETEKVALPADTRRMQVIRPGLEPWQTAGQAARAGTYGVTMAVGDSGAWVSNENLLYFTVGKRTESETFRLAWNVDPFRFLEAAVGAEGLPRPDVTTFWGARGAYAHADLDQPYTRGRDYPGPSRFVFDIVYEHVLQNYPYPVTLGLVACEFDPELDVRFLEKGDTLADALGRPRRSWQGTQRETAVNLKKIADKAFSLPHVFAGCHSYSHPAVWKEKVPGYAIAGYDFSYETETAGAVEYLNKNVLPPDKRVELFQWTGDNAPPEEPLAVLRRLDLPNSNGGDPRYDGRFDSVSFICALTRPVGNQLQIHTSGSSQPIYSEGFTEFKGAYNNVITTFERSDSPRRLLPVNIYFSVQPAEWRAGLIAIRHAFEWALDQDLCWIKASEYARAVESFAGARLGKTGDGGWWVEEYGACPSVRFDGEARAVDMAASRNVAGWHKEAENIYVALIPGERAEIRFAGQDADVPCLARSSGMLRGIEASAGRWRAEVRGWGKGFVEIWAPRGEWRGSLTRGGAAGEKAELDRLEDGRLRLTLPDAAGEWVEVVFEL